MPRIIFFTIHRTTPWWLYLASRIDFADVTVLSDLRGDGDRTLVDDFYHFMAERDVETAALLRFGETRRSRAPGTAERRRTSATRRASRAPRRSSASKSLRFD